jgi:hypothetical protein
MSGIDVSDRAQRIGAGKFSVCKNHSRGFLPSPFFLAEADKTPGIKEFAVGAKGAVRLNGADRVKIRSAKKNSRETWKYSTVNVHAM